MTTKEKDSEKPEVKQEAKQERQKQEQCGVVMPISAIDGCSEQHWTDVKRILDDAIRSAELEPHLVSDADEIGIIHKRIVENLYKNPIVVCDVSCKNPNVMFELGLRLAFDKPTIIVKDNKTAYTFDTGIVEHLEYPRDLHYHSIVNFKNKLQEKITATLEKSKEDGDYSPYLKHLGGFTAVKLETKELTKDEYLIQEVSELKSLIRHSLSSNQNRNINLSSQDVPTAWIASSGLTAEDIIGVSSVEEILEQRKQEMAYNDARDASRKILARELSIENMRKIAQGKANVRGSDLP